MGGSGASRGRSPNDGPLRRTGRPDVPAVLLSASLALALALACGGQTTDPASGVPCSVTQQCPEGERCDDGVCVADRACPEPGVRVLLDAVDFPYNAMLLDIDGKPYLAWEPLGPGGERRLLDLELSTPSTLAIRSSCHLPHHCLEPTDTGAILHRHFTNEGGVWTAADRLTLISPTGFMFLSLGSPWGSPSEGLLLSDRLSLYRLELASGELRPLVDLGGRQVLYYPIETPAPPRLVTGDRGDDSITYDVIALSDPPVWTHLADDVPVSLDAAVLPAGDSWLILNARAPGDPTTTQGWRVTGGTARMTGETADLALFNELTGWGRAAIAAGEDPVGVPRCSEARCGLHHVDLTTLGTTLASSVHVPKESLYVVASTPLACGALELVVGGRDPSDAEGTASFYSVRVVPGQR